MPCILQNGWRARQLTFGSEEERFHSHSYYDIPILDSFEQRIAAYRVGFCNRQPTSEDVVTVGLVDLEKGGFTAVGESRAWSWQQGPMAQWISGNRLCWNDREGRSFVARIFDFKEGITRTLPRPIYAVDPNGRFGLSTNMARLEKARPGYGYSGGASEEWDKNCPTDDGVWRIDLASGHCQLILPLAHALEFLRSRAAADEWTNHTAEHPMYWFNHIKLSPDGRRFTVKFRWRSRNLNLSWNDTMGVSFTCNIDGSGVRLLARATSHVMWLDSTALYFWDATRKCIAMVDDSAPEGTFIHDLVPNLIRKNAHLRHFPNSRRQFVYDTPYREKIDLLILDHCKSSAKRIARFTNHIPRRGPFRCDLHPVPSFDGSRIIVASLQDGGRQIYVLERDGTAKLTSDER